MGTMEISYDKKTEIEKKQIYAMYQEIFQDPEAFAEYYFHYLYPKNQVLELKQDGRLASMLHLNPYTIVWRGEELDANYIVAVATLDCFRRQGMMAKLLKRAFRNLYDRGQLFTYLIPAKEAYYKPFDFSFIMNWEEGKVRGRGKRPLDFMKDGRKSDTTGTGALDYQIRKVLPSMYKEAAHYLNELRREHFVLWVKADEAYFRQQDAEMRSEGGGIYLIKKGEKPEGLFFCTMDEDSLSCTNLWIPEGMTEEELTSLLFHKFGKEEIDLCLPGRNRTEGLSTKPVPRIMARILRLARLLERMRGSRQLSLSLYVEDKFLVENEGCFLWQLGPKGSRVMRTEKAPDWKMGIGSLTEILFGYGSLEEKLLEAPSHVKEFFYCLEPMTDISITEQV